MEEQRAVVLPIMLSHMLAPHEAGWFFLPSSSISAHNAHPLHRVFLLCIPYTLENNSCRLHVKTAQNLTAAELTALVLTANLAGKKCVLVRGLLI